MRHRHDVTQRQATQPIRSWQGRRRRRAGSSAPSRSTAKRHSENHPQVAVDLANLAYAEKDLGHLQEARELFERALQIDEAALGASHPEVADDCRGLATALSLLGEEDRARELRERARTIDNR